MRNANVNKKKVPYTVSLWSPSLSNVPEYDSYHSDSSSTIEATGTVDDDFPDKINVKNMEHPQGFQAEVTYQIQRWF